MDDLPLPCLTTGGSIGNIKQPQWPKKNMLPLHPALGPGGTSSHIHHSPPKGALVLDHRSE